MIGTVVGALGGAGLAVAYNHKKEINGTVVTWSKEANKNFFSEAVLLYLAVAHFGRGRGNWDEQTVPEHWLECINKAIPEQICSTPQTIDVAIRQILRTLYPEIRI